MTEGKIIKSIIIYAIPLILGNFMQQLYSTVDSFVVGNYVGATALAAVGASGQLTYFLIAFCLGASAGGGILISQFYGAKSYDELHHVIHNMLGIAVVLGLVSTVVGVAFCPQLLRAMGTPEDMMPEAVLYLRIYFGGMIFMTFYNMLAAILNAVGNSTRSLQYLVVSSLVNIALDFLLICGFGMGVEGAAIATVISQGVSSILAFRYLAKVDAPYRVVFRDISLDKYWAMRVVRIGLPAAIQNAVISFSNILIQTGVNAYGTNVVAGFSAYMKVDGFNILPILSFSMAATTFVGQNIGAGKRKRAFQGAAMIFVINLCYTLMMTAIMLGFDTQIISAFSKEPEVITSGVMCIWALAPFYSVLGVIHSLAGALRGTGDTMGPMAIILISLCLFRVIWIWTMTSRIDGVMGVYLTYPTSFVLGAVLMVIYVLFKYHCSKQKKEKLW